MGVARAAEEEEFREHSVILEVNGGDDDLVEGIKNKNEVFLVIQTQSESAWGLLIKIMNVMGRFDLDVIDHRAWSPRGINTTLVNEVYARCPLDTSGYEAPEKALEALIEKLTKTIISEIDQPDSKVKVQRWFPGVVKEVVEETDEKKQKNIRERLLVEASTNLERKQKIQLDATTAKTVEEITGDEVAEGPKQNVEKDKMDDLLRQSVLPNSSGTPEQSERPRRRHRHKTHSTPVVGGGLFGEEVVARSGRDGSRRMDRVSDFSTNKDNHEDLNFTLSSSSDLPARITVQGEVFHIRISENSWKDLKTGVEGQTTDSRGVPLSGIEITARDDAPVVQRLQGFVRNPILAKIQEASEFSEGSSDVEDR